MEIKRGDIYYANLSPVVGSEQGGIRPVVVIQNNKGNQHSPTIMAAAITSRKKTLLPTHVEIEVAGLDKQSIVLLEQVRTIDRSRLFEYIGKLNEEQISRVNEALSISLDLKDI